MTYQFVLDITNRIIKTIENVAIVGVKTLRNTIITHTYPVKVTNPVSKVDVKGTVIVANQSKVEQEIKKTLQLLQEIKKVLPSLKDVSVGNFPKYPEFPKYPTEIKVSNLKNTTEITNWGEILKSISNLEKSVEKLKLNPKISVESPVIPAPIVNVPKQEAPHITLNEKEVDLKPVQKAIDDLTKVWETFSARNPLAVRLSDGKAFYKAIDRLSESIANNSSPFQTSTGADARPYVDENSNIVVTTNDTWGLNNTEEITDTKYLGKENVGGKYQIIRIITDGDAKDLKYATIRNNPNIGDYTEAWAERTSLDYGLVSETF